MSASDAASVVNAASWADDAYYAKEFVHRHRLPRVVRVVKGQYMGLGAGSIAAPSATSTLLIVSLGKAKRILAQVGRVTFSVFCQVECI